MSTVQKAFVFIVLVLAVLLATVQLVLFAQRDNYSEMLKAEQARSADLDTKLKAAQSELAQVKSDKSTAVADLEAQLGTVKTDLDSTKRQLESTLGDKSNLESLVANASAKLEVMGQKVDAIAARNNELNTAKLALEEELTKVKAARQDAEEQYTIAVRKARDLEQKVSSLTQQLDDRSEQMANLEQEVRALRLHYPGEMPSVSAPGTATVFGKITSLSNDGNTVYLSIGSDDGVKMGMTMILYKADGTYAADGQVFNVSADRSAARVVKPVRATIAEGDYVANK